MGIYVYSPTAIDHIPTGRFDFPDLVLALIAAGERVCKYRFDGAWFDIGTAGQLELATSAFEADPRVFEPALRTAASTPVSAETRPTSSPSGG